MTEPTDSPIEPTPTLMGEPSAPEAAPAEAPATAPTVGFSEEGWLKGVELDIVNDPSMKAIKDLSGLAKSYVHAQRMVGKDKALIPNERSSEQEWKNFYSKLGMPAEETAYNIDVDADNSKLGKDVIENFKKIAYANNMLPKQATEALKFIEQSLAAKEEASYAAMDTNVKESLEGLKKEWGNDYDAQLIRAKRVINMFGDDDFKKYMNESGLGNDVNFIKLMNKIGTSLKEDNFQDDVVGHLGITRDDAQKQVNQIFGNMQSAYYDQNHPAHADEVEKVNKLFKVMSGEA